MARPIKYGLDYFPFDVDFFSDHKIQFIRAKYGSKALITIIQLYCKIYRDGYFITWDEDASMIFSKYEGGISRNELNLIIQECFNRDIFNRSIHDRFGILTSIGIQKRFFEASRKRKSLKVVFEYLLININDYGISDIVNSELTPINSVNSTQRKGKERREKETIKVNTLNNKDFIQTVEILNSENEIGWRETIMQVSKVKTESNLTALLKEFLLIQKANNYFPHDLSDTKRYFLNWVRAKVTTETSGRSISDVLESKMTLIGES